MQLLLNTHALLWWLNDDRKLGSSARAAITDASNVVFVSAASSWEIEVKRGRGKLAFDGDVADAIERCGFLELSIAVSHTKVAAGLPHHHGDPFDRLLVAQARSEGLWLVTGDAAIRQYDVPWIDAGA